MEHRIFKEPKYLLKNNLKTFSPHEPLTDEELAFLEETACATM